MLVTTVHNCISTPKKIDNGIFSIPATVNTANCVLICPDPLINHSTVAIIISGQCVKKLQSNHVIRCKLIGLVLPFR